MSTSFPTTATSPAPRAEEIVVPFSLAQWQLYVAKESELLRHSAGLSREQRYLEMVDLVAESLLEFGLEPEIVREYRRDVAEPLTDERFTAVEHTVAATLFAAASEPETVPLRQRQLVREMVGAIRQDYLGAGAQA